MTKLDVLTGLPEIKIATHYKIGARVLPDGYMPASLEQFDQVEPVYLTLPGWTEDISKCTSFEELPNNAKRWKLGWEAGVARGWLSLARSPDLCSIPPYTCPRRPLARYVLTVQQLIGVPISWIGVGPGRESMFLMPGYQS